MKKSYNKYQKWEGKGSIIILFIYDDCMTGKFKWRDWYLVSSENYYIKIISFSILKQPVRNVIE